MKLKIPSFKSPLRRQSFDIGEAIVGGRMPDKKERQFIENTLRIPMHKFADRKAYLEVGSKMVWASFRACHLTASIVLSTVFRIQGQKTGAEVEDPELMHLLSQPNPHDSWEELLYMWTFHMKLTGVAFWYKDQMDIRGRPKHIYPLIPQYVAAIPHPTDKVGGYLYKVNGREIKFETDEIIMFRRPHPTKVLDGMGDIEPSETIYSEYIMRGEMEKKFLANGAMPSGVLTKKEAIEDEDEWGKMKEWWKAEYEGDRNVGKTAFLNGEWAYLKLGLTHQEMQSIESEKWSIEQIFTNHGVPHSVAGLDKAANLATARQDEINFRKYEIVPLLDILVGKLNMGVSGGETTLIRAYSPVWEIVYELSGLIDVEQVVKDYKPLVDAGAMTLNELREVCGLERKEDPMLDQHFIASTRLPLEMAGLTAVVPPALPPAPAEEDEDEREDPKTPQQKVDGDVDEDEWADPAKAWRGMNGNRKKMVKALIKDIETQDTMTANGLREYAQTLEA